MTTRIARCCCGALRAEVTGEPPRVGVCHCMECQRRTGSAFGVVAFFRKEQVRVEGSSKVYVRRSDSGRKVEFHFCPDCGTSLFWYAEFRPDHVGIAFWRVRRPGDDALAGDISVGGDATSVDNPRSPGRSVYRPRIDAHNALNRLMLRFRVTPTAAIFSRRA